MRKKYDFCILFYLFFEGWLFLLPIYYKLVLNKYKEQEK
jgi:hypothetical protein